MAVWLLAGAAAHSFYTFTPQGPASAPAWTAPAVYPEYVQTPYAPQYVPVPQYEQPEEWSMSSAMMVLGAGAVGVAAGVALRPVAALAVSADSKEASVAVGAACVGGVLGVYLFGDLTAGLILALIAAYCTTVKNGVGEASRKVGSVYNQAYDKTVELNEQYDILEKAKSAADFTVAAAVDFDESYQLTAKVDEKLKLSQAVEKAKGKISDVTEGFPQKIQQKVEDLKTKSIEVN